jgi:hypothetical protein
MLILVKLLVVEKGGGSFSEKIGEKRGLSLPAVIYGQFVGKEGEKRVPLIST